MKFNDDGTESSHVSLPDIDENDEKYADVDENTILLADKRVPHDLSVKNY
jgi:hypothetical protein